MHALPPQALNRTILVSLALAVGLLNILPSIVFYYIGGDVVLSYTLLQCIGEQLWQGHFYPRWCMNANAGYGSPAPIFYFPLGYYANALIYPLRWFGMQVHDIFFIALWQVSIVAFITTTLWLRQYTTNARAMCCAAVFLWLGYRMEALVFRTSYAESWAIALMPLLFMQLRNPRWAPMALVIALLLLAHMPATVIALMACGIYLLMLNPRRLPTLLLATLLAVLATLFHWYASHAFSGTLHPVYGGISFWKGSWVNSFADHFFADMQLFVRPQFEGMYERVGWLGGAGAILMFTIAFAICRRGRLPQDIRPEALVWLLIMLFGLFMMFSPSAPLWDVITTFSQVKTPWRMAMLVMFGFTALLAIGSREIWPAWGKAKKSVTMVTLALLMICGACMLQVVPPDEKTAASRGMVIYAQQLLRYYNLRWLDLRYVYPTEETFYRELLLNRPEARASFTDGTGQAAIDAWGYDGIVIRSTRDTAGVLRIEHFYHPLWRAMLDGRDISLAPEENGAGRMQLLMPAGSHTLTLSLDAAHALSPVYRVISILSLISALIIALGCFRNRPRTQQE